jgi:precorrin-2 dehydrogenase/sirohydrochlorin ferrochelatase
MDEQQIESLGGGSLLIAWQLRHMRVLIVGGGEIASQRILSILHTDAPISLLAPSDGLHPRTRRYLELRNDRITHIDRILKSADDIELEGVHMVLTALDDPVLSAEIVSVCRSRHIPVNAADLPDLCDFYFGAHIRDGPLQIVFSTNGNGPRMAALVRDKIQNALSGYEGDAISRVGLLRVKLKEKAPGVGGDVSKERMRWMTKLCDTWPMEDLAAVDETIMEKLIQEGWEKGRKVPTATEMGLRPTKRRISWAMLDWKEFQPIPAAAAFALGVISTTILLTFRTRRF